MKKYEKPMILAKNNPQGSYAAGCPDKGTGSWVCKSCERTQ